MLGSLVVRVRLQRSVRVRVRDRNVRTEGQRTGSTIGIVVHCEDIATDDGEDSVRLDIALRPWRIVPQSVTDDCNVSMASDPEPRSALTHRRRHRRQDNQCERSRSGCSSLVSFSVRTGRHPQGLPTIGPTH